MVNLYNCINNTEYLKSKIINNMMNHKDSNNSFKIKFICDNDIKKISSYIMSSIQGNKLSETEISYGKVVHNIIKNILKHTKKINVRVVIFILKCYKKAYVDLVLEEGFDDKIKLETIRHISDFFDNIEIIACVDTLSIVQEKKEQVAVKENEDSYRKLLEVMPDAVYVHCRGKVVYTNKAGVKLMGYKSSEEIVGKSQHELLEINEYDKPLIKQQGDITMRNGRLSPVERKFFRKSDGKFLEVETTSAVILHEGEKAILNITRDISERKRIEFLKQKVKQKTLLLNKTIEYNKLRTEFFTNISHELRTPLNMILGALQLVNSKNDDCDVVKYEVNIKKYMPIMKQNCYRLLRLVDNLIDITKIDAGYLEISLKNDNIVKVVEDIVQSVATYVESKGLELIFDTDIEEKYMAFDADKIERIMLNLISNAIKFTKTSGQVYVNIYDNKNTISITVRDTGIGIPIEKHKEVFERFVQVDKSLSRDREGSGIGLSLVKSLVGMHGGEVYINKEIIQGSEFVIELPVNIIDEVNVCNDSLGISEKYIERIKVEFSDIYS